MRRGRGEEIEREENEWRREGRNWEVREEHKINKGKNKLSRNRRRRIENQELMRVRKSWTLSSPQDVWKSEKLLCLLCCDVDLTSEISLCLNPQWQSWGSCRSLCSGGVWVCVMHFGIQSQWYCANSVCEQFKDGRVRVMRSFHFGSEMLESNRSRRSVRCCVSQQPVYLPPPHLCHCSVFSTESSWQVVNLPQICKHSNKKQYVLYAVICPQFTPQLNFPVLCWQRAEYCLNIK